MSSSNEAGKVTKSPKPAAKTTTKKTAVANYSIFTPSGIVVRLSDTVEWTVLSLDKQAAASDSVLRSALCRIVLGVPLRVCRVVLLGLGSVLGVKLRPMLHVHRKAKDRRSLRLPQGTEPVEGSPAKTEGVRFDFSHSPDACKMLNVMSPNKRKPQVLLSTNDSILEEEDSEMESSCDEDSSDDEVIDHMKMLNQSDLPYHSEEDPDFEPPSEGEERALEEREEFDELNESVVTEPNCEQVYQESPCMTDHSVVELSFEDKDDIKNAQLVFQSGSDEPPHSLSSHVEPKGNAAAHGHNAPHMPLKSTENFADVEENSKEDLLKQRQMEQGQLDQENSPQVAN